MRFALVATSALLLLSCSVAGHDAKFLGGPSLPTPSSQRAPGGPAESGSACADLYISATTGKRAPGVIACLSPDYRASWAKAGVTSDEKFSAAVGAWSRMTGWHYIGRDVAGHLVYDLFNKHSTHVQMIVFLDKDGLVQDNIYFAYQG